MSFSLHTLQKYGPSGTSESGGVKQNKWHASLHPSHNSMECSSFVRWHCVHAVDSSTFRVQREPFLDGLCGISAFITAVNGISDNGMKVVDELGTTGMV